MDLQARVLLLGRTVKALGSIYIFISFVLSIKAQTHTVPPFHLSRVLQETEAVMR